MVVYSAYDVLAFAKDLQRRRARFYTRASSRAEDAGAKALLDRLAEEALRQLPTIDLLLRQLPARGQAGCFGSSAEASVTLDAMARGPFLDYVIDPQVTLTGQETADEIAAMAEGLAENTLIFYRAVKEMVFAESGRDQIDLLIGAEAHPSSRANEPSPRTIALELPQSQQRRKAA